VCARAASVPQQTAVGSRPYRRFHVPPGGISSLFLAVLLALFLGGGGLVVL